jgi:hypothetical protein
MLVLSIPLCWRTYNNSTCLLSNTALFSKPLYQEGSLYRLYLRRHVSALYMAIIRSVQLLNELITLITVINLLNSCTDLMMAVWRAETCRKYKGYNDCPSYHGFENKAVFDSKQVESLYTWLLSSSSSSLFSVSSVVFFFASSFQSLTKIAV